MTASLDEAFSNFLLDAPASTDTTFYLLLDDNAFGLTATVGDRDAYKLILDRGSSYTLIATDNSNGFDTFVDLYDRNGTFLFSSDLAGSGDYTALSFTTNDTLYYAVTRSAGTGYYLLRIGNNTVSETNNVGQEVFADTPYSGALDYTSDSDHFFFTAEAGHTYQVAITTTVPDLFLKVSSLNTAYTPVFVTGSSGLYSFTSTVSGRYDLTISANSFVSRGSYSFIAHDVTGGTAGGGGGAPITGTSGADSLVGTAASEQISAGAGNDSVSGGAGADTIDGGEGTNYLRGDDGNDSIVGGTGFDDINGNMGNDTCVSGGGDDWVVGGKDNDSLMGSAGQNLVYGNLGADTCDGGAGNDIVRGGQDNDSCIGGAGDDFVSGDKGDDTLVGGTGADSFHTFGDAGIDRVLDFHLSEGDRVQLDPGTQYTVSQVGADTVINMVGGGQMILVGVSMSTLTGNWIFGN